jgi:chromosome partitioning protein
MGKIISFSNQKGGVGKTTSCVNLSAYCAAAGKKVLLVDMDPQGNATTGLGFTKSSIKKTVYDILNEHCVAKDAMLATEVDNLFILPANIDLAGAEIDLVYKRGREKVLRKAIEPLKKEFDFIFIDCPPSLGMLTINAMVASDSVIIPIQSEYFAMEGLTQLVNSVSMVKQSLNRSLEVEGVLLTMFDSRSLIAKQIADEIRRYFNKKVYEIIIPRNVRLAEAPSHGKPVMLHDDKCVGARAYKAFTDEFLARQQQE